MATKTYWTRDRQQGARFAGDLTTLGYTVDLLKDTTRPGRFTITASSDTLPDPDSALLSSFPAIQEA